MTGSFLPLAFACSVLLPANSLSVTRADPPHKTCRLSKRTVPPPARSGRVNSEEKRWLRTLAAPDFPSPNEARRVEPEPRAKLQRASQAKRKPRPGSALLCDPAGNPTRVAPRAVTWWYADDELPDDASVLKVLFLYRTEGTERRNGSSPPFAVQQPPAAGRAGAAGASY